MAQRIFSGMLLCLVVIAGVASAGTSDPALGLWKTEPDRKNLVSYVEIRPCGEALCGRIKAAYDPAGNPVQTPNIGRALFWDLMPQGDGSYRDGEVYVPLLDITARAKAKLTGDQLRVTGCKGVFCDGQTWSRVR